jgi:hypothetical protein
LITDVPDTVVEVNADAVLSSIKGEVAMSDSEPRPTREPGERIPAMQSLLDNPFLLLFLGVTMPTVFYLIWGIMEIVTLPVAP